jgi:hypothetical protein
MPKLNMTAEKINRTKIEETFLLLGQEIISSLFLSEPVQQQQQQQQNFKELPTRISQMSCSVESLNAVFNAKRVCPN